MLMLSNQQSTQTFLNFAVSDHKNQRHNKELNPSVECTYFFQNRILIYYEKQDCLLRHHRLNLHYPRNDFGNI